MPRPRTTKRLPPAAAALLGLVLLSAALRAWAGSRVTGLWIAPDEMIWGALGRSLWEDGDLEIFGGTAVFGLVYPALIGAPLAHLDLERGLEVVRAGQAVLMSLTAVPVYLWARRLATPAWALVAAALTLALPELVYSGLLLSEAAFLPVAVLAAWALAAALERPDRRNQALLVAAVVLASATRLQALVLPLVVVTAAVVEGLLAGDVRRALRLWPATAAMVVLGVAWAVWRAAVDGGAGAALGGYEGAAETGYGVGAVAAATLHHAGGLLLGTGIVPACAVALLLLRGRRADPALRAYLAVVVGMLWLVVQVGAFASEWISGTLSTRYLLALAPLLFVGFAAWLARGAPRGRLAAGLVALAALLVLLGFPPRELVVQEAAWQSPVVVALIWLRERAGESALELAVWGGAAALLALFALVPRRAVAVLPALVLAWLAFASFAVSREVAQNVAFDREHLVGGEPRWVDARVDGTAAYVYAGEQPLNIVWHQLFWNRSLEHVVAIAEPSGGIPAGVVAAVAEDGTLRAGDETEDVGWLVAVEALRLRGEPVARVPLASGGQTGLVLWRAEPPVRVSWLLTGVQENGDLYEPARLRAWDCGSGRLELTLLPKAATRVELRVNGETTQTLEVAGQEFVNATVDGPEGAELCEFEIVPDALLGSTRIEFVRG